MTISLKLTADIQKLVNDARLLHNEQLEAEKSSQQVKMNKNPANNYNNTTVSSPHEFRKPSTIISKSVNCNNAPIAIPSTSTAKHLGKTSPLPIPSARSSTSPIISTAMEEAGIPYDENNLIDYDPTYNFEEYPAEIDDESEKAGLYEMAVREEEHM